MTKHTPSDWSAELRFGALNKLAESEFGAPP